MKNATRSLGPLWLDFVGRLHRMRTVLNRRVRSRPSEEAALRDRIDKRIRELGLWYEDGNSDLVGHTYHPIPFPGYEGIRSHRPEMAGRLKCIVETASIRPGDWVLDVGANVGFFSFSLERLGALVEAYESNSATFEIGAALSKMHNTNVLFINKTFGTRVLPFLRGRYRCILLLSVFHWIVKQEGEKAASALLAELGRRTDRIYFEPPSSLADGQFQHEIFKSRDRTLSFITSALPACTVTELAVDRTWSDRRLYCFHFRTIA